MSSDVNMSFLKRSSFEYKEIEFDLEKYASKDKSIHSSLDDYFTVNLQNGIYFLQIANNDHELYSIREIVGWCLVEVNDQRIKWICKEFISPNEISYFLSNIIQQKLYAILTKFIGDHIIIKRIFSNPEVIFSKTYQQELAFYVSELMKHEDSILKHLFLSILYYLQGNYVNSTLAINKTIQIAKYSGHYSFLNYLKNIKTYIANLNNGLPRKMIQVHMLSPTNEALKAGDQHEYLYAKQIEKSLNEVISTPITVISGNKTTVIQRLMNARPKLLILFGHGNREKGYNISDAIEDETHPENFTNEDLKNLLQGYADNEDFLFLDFVCCHDHYFKINFYGKRIILFSSRRHEYGSFSRPSAYYFALGFFNALLRTDDYHECFQMAKLSMSMCTYEYADSYTFDII
jgi:hypothetical protein